MTSGLKGVVLRRLKSGDPTPIEDLVAHVYGASGGPLNADKCIQVTVGQLRRAGHPIRNLNPVGRGNHAVYTL